MSNAYDFQRIAILGAGTMGHGIAHVAAVAGMEVTLYDVRMHLAERGVDRMTANLEESVRRGKLSSEAAVAARGRVRPTDSMEDACANVDAVIEAAPERLDLKCEIFSRVAQMSPSEALLGTNTSSLPITEIASSCAAPGRVIGLHFFNPPYVLTLLEIVRAVQTTEATIDAAVALAERLGRDYLVTSDTPGFATSRLGVALGLEAIRMLETGVAHVADIDRAMTLGYRHPMGPLMLTDQVGLDVRLAIAEHLHREVGEQFRPPALLRQMVRAGLLGRKTGEGFYRWVDGKAVAR